MPPDSGLDQDDVATITEMARAKGWTNEQAQVALSEYAESAVAQRTTLLRELEAHPEIGGEQLAVSREYATRALDRLLPATTLEGKALRQWFNKSGTGNYAPLVLLLARAGRAMGEDAPLGHRRDNAPRTDARDPVAVLYGSSPTT